MRVSLGHTVVLGGASVEHLAGVVSAVIAVVSVVDILKVLGVTFPVRIYMRIILDLTLATVGSAWIATGVTVLPVPVLVLVLPVLPVLVTWVVHMILSPANRSWCATYVYFDIFHVLRVD